MVKDSTKKKKKTVLNLKRNKANKVKQRYCIGFANQ